jgi:hypothetical protein
MIIDHHEHVGSSPPAGFGLPADTLFERMPVAGGGTCDLAMVAVPTAEAAEHDIAVAEALAAAGTWAATAGAAPPLVLPLYGTCVVWSPGRCVAVAPPDRLPALRNAIVEFADLDAELRDIERRVAASLEHLDGDAPLAFMFDAQALPRRPELAARFSEVVSLRRRLAVLAPQATRPAPQPPTLAGQIGERLRERTRVGERLEHAVEQAELLERVYAGCGDRAAEFEVSRRHLALEWVLVVLLATEVLLITVDLLAASGS